ncbi:adenosylcobinamide-GDP ribazoletransferase [Bacilliculturomica massiliensis]|uniref:adenosylcobinamide-GDP ribazoletransferase n=1 Tax=Bacilliculturomica massiliensis TaxID=1917867 RepID=UPI00103069C3
MWEKGSTPSRCCCRSSCRWPCRSQWRPAAARCWVLASGALKPGALAADADGAGFLSAMGLSLFGETFGPATAAAGINLVAVIAGMGSVSLLTGYLKKVLGGITGDTMGMVCETSQMVFVFAVYLLNNI